MTLRWIWAVLAGAMFVIGPVAAQDAAPAAQPIASPARSYTLAYEASVSGIGVADIEITATFERWPLFDQRTRQHVRRGKPFR